MNPILVEGQFGHGGLGHFLKPTDWKYHSIAPTGSVPFDWSQGYDVEAELSAFLKIPGFSMRRKNQGASGSCGGQLLSYYHQGLKAFKNGSFSEDSAKDVYAVVFQPGGGSLGGPLMDRVRSAGVARESLVPSYENGLPPSEAFMERRQDISLIADIDGAQSKSSSYSFIIDFDIDTLAQACRDNHGIGIGIFGQNNGTWLSPFPAVPSAVIGSTVLWGHWIFVKGAVMINGNKYLILLNSWGDKIGIGGQQYLSEAYVNSGFVQLGIQMSLAQPQSYLFNKDLYSGMIDADVYFLQKKLNQYSTTQVATSGPGAPGSETYYFGTATKAAVMKYQAMNGISPAIGYVGTLTRAVLNS